MSSHNELSDLENMRFNGGQILNFATAAPAGSEVGYAPGCLWVYSVATNAKLYINTGTAAAATWTVVGAQS